MRVQLTQRLAPQGDVGAVAVVVALLLTVLMVLAAFAVDIGAAYARARQQSVSADASALAAAAAVADAYPLGQSCSDTTLATINADALAKATADSLNTKNTVASGTEPVSSATVACDGTDAFIVSVTNHHPVKTVLAGVIGIDQIDPGSFAKARVTRASSAGGLRPWAVCDEVALRAQNNPDQTYATGLDNQVGPCNSTAAGNWGGVDFNGGSNSAGDLAAWTLNGYPGPVDIPDPLLPADPGVSNSSALALAFNSLVGKVVLFPTVTGYNSGGGNTASFNAIGVVTVKICGILYANTAYNAGSDCWRDPNGTPYSGSIAAGSTTVTTTSVAFTPANVGQMVGIKGAGPSSSNGWLVTYITAVAPNGLSATLETPATSSVTDAPQGNQPIPQSVHVGEVVVQQSSNGNPIDHVQFRYQDYTSSYTGSSAQPCPFTSRNCVSVVSLWQ